MNIAKEPLGHIQVYCDKHFITLTVACDFLALEHFTAFLNQKTLQKTTRRY